MTKLILNIFFMIVFIQLNTVLSDDNSNDYFDIYDKDDSYRGEKFPQKYLSVDGVQPTKDDLSYYVTTLWRIVNYFEDVANESDPNVGIGSYLAKAVLKRTLLDYGHKIGEHYERNIKEMINKIEDINSHFIYTSKTFYETSSMMYKLGRMFTYDDSLVYSIGKFNKNVMKKWINSNIKINDYIQEMDNLTLPKDTYARLVVNMDDYYMASISDICIASISTHPMPLKKDAELRRCHHNEQAKECRDKVLSMPSVAYALSHQYIYLMGLALTRRCYVVSEAADIMHMEIMCANMYREAVYLARRGYFYRDIFLEHITLCALLGFEEFHRYNWFKKAASWVDEDGCVNENRNFEINRTRIYIENAKSSREIKHIRKSRLMKEHDECLAHQMILMVNVLAHGIRHAAHFMETIYA